MRLWSRWPNPFHPPQGLCEPAGRAASPGATWVLTALLAASAGCAPYALLPSGELSPGETRALEDQLRRAPGDVPTLILLGGAYRASNRGEEARTLLERARQRDPSNMEALLHLALTYESVEAWGEAAAAYDEYARLGEGRQLRAEAASRVPLMRRRALEQEVRQSLAREAELAGRDPEPTTVAVFPFRYLGSDPDLRPLSRALAEMLVTDLAVTDRLRVVERLRVQLLLDEIALGEAGLVEPSTAARGGQLLGAGRIVQGEIGGDQDLLRFQAAVVPVGRELDRLPSNISDQDPARQFFDAQKRMALAIYEAVGVELTPAERERVNRRPTENVQALLAYGLGLEAEDAGRFDEAVGHFNTAVQLDGGFQEARARAVLAGGAGSSQAVTAGELSEIAFRESIRDMDLDGLLAQRIGIEELERLLPETTPRDPLPEVEGTEGLGAGLGVLLEIILRRP